MTVRHDTSWLADDLNPDLNDQFKIHSAATRLTSTVFARSLYLL